MHIVQKIVEGEGDTVRDSINYYLENGWTVSPEGYKVFEYLGIVHYCVLIQRQATKSEIAKAPFQGAMTSQGLPLTQG